MRHSNHVRPSSTSFRSVRPLTLSRRATCLGPPAQAIISLSSSTLSTASITLSPRKTDLWSSSLSPTSLALGCDGNVLVAEVADLAGRGEGGEGRVSGGMTPYVTKSAVYAVEQSIVRPSLPFPPLSAPSSELKLGAEHDLRRHERR